MPRLPVMRDSERPAVPPTLDRLAAMSWRFLVVAAALAVVAFVLVQLRLVVLPVIAALFLATLLVPPVRWLRDRGWPPLLAAWVVTLGSVALLGAIGAAFVPLVAQELEELGSSILEGVEEVEDWLIAGPLGLSPEQVDRFFDQAIEQVRANAGSITAGVLAGAVLAVEIVAGTLLTIVLLFFFLKDGPKITGWIRSHVSGSRRDLLETLGRRAWMTLGAYIRGTALIGVADAVLIGIGLLVIGVPLVAPLMVLTFLGAFFPLVGAVVAGLVAALVALVSGGPIDALLVVGIVVVVQQVEGDVLAPLVLGRAVKLHAVVVLLALTAGAVVAGVAGAFLAVPAAGVAAAIGNELRTRRNDSPPGLLNSDE